MSEKKNETMKKYYIENRDKMKEWFKLYYQNNTEKKNAKEAECIIGIIKKKNILNISLKLF